MILDNLMYSGKFLILNNNMKTTINSIIIILFCSSAVLNGQNKDTIRVPKAAIKWYKFEEALVLNNNYPKKKIFIDVYTEWCGWCKKMDATTFKDSAVVAYMNEKYYAVKFDAETKDTISINGRNYVNMNQNEKRGVHQIAADLLQGKMSYPSYVILNEIGNKMTVENGFKPAAEFYPVIRYFGDNEYIRMPYSEFRQKSPSPK